MTRFIVRIQGGRNEARIALRGHHPLCTERTLGFRTRSGEFCTCGWLSNLLSSGSKLQPHELGPRPRSIKASCPSQLTPIRPTALPAGQAQDGPSRQPPHPPRVALLTHAPSGAFCPMDRDQLSLLYHAAFLPRMVVNLRWKGTLRPQKHIPPCLYQEPESLLPEPQAPEGSSWSWSPAWSQTQVVPATPSLAHQGRWMDVSGATALLPWLWCPFKASHPLQCLSLGMGVPQEPLAAGTFTLPISQIKKLRLGELSH